jgi:hypothetical protein
MICGGKMLRKQKEDRFHSLKTFETGQDTYSHGTRWL